MQTVTSIELRCARTCVPGVMPSLAQWPSCRPWATFTPAICTSTGGRARACGTCAGECVRQSHCSSGPSEDFTRYPRTPVEDQQLLAQAHCDLLFAPSVEEIYPAGGQQATIVTVRGLSDILCGQFRPGHFDGVATVVAKLFGIVSPDVAVFGEKDYQQFMVIRRMTLDLALPVEVVGAPTVRADDGLALSSRNRYLSAEERTRAPAMFQALRAAVAAIAAGERDYVALEKQGWLALERAGMRPDYFTILSASDLSEPQEQSAPLVVLAAARLGRARLIDNLRTPGG
jgi:pantoate--beta-alanine ligase